MLDPHRDPPRRCDLAIIDSDKLIEMLQEIWRIRYDHLSPRNFSKGLELMVVQFIAQVATRAGTPLTASEIARKAVMPRTNVDKRLKFLEKLGRVHLVKTKWVADLDQLDELMTPQRYKIAMGIVHDWVAQLEALRPLFQ